MSEYLYVEKPFLDQLAQLGWTVMDQGCGGVPSDPARSLRASFRECVLTELFRESIRDLNRNEDGSTWLTDSQLDDLRDQILRQPNRSLLEANETAHARLHKAQVDRNEVTGEADPVVRLIDFAHPERNRFHAINQFRVDTPGCVKSCIIPDVVLFVNGIPLVVVEAKVGGPNTANPMHAAFEQLLRYRNGRPETTAAGLREGEPRLFHSNLLLIRSCGECCEFGTLTSGHEHFHAWRTPDSADGNRGTPREQEQLIRGLLPPSTLVDLLRTCTVYMDTDDGKRIKVVARHQQYRAACRILDRIRQGKTPMERSGVIWHTQGSGKSLTMVFVARMLRASPDLADFKIVLVNDRIVLEEQLARTARLIGGKVHVIDSSDTLREHLSTDASDINMVMVHKFKERREVLPSMVAEALAPYGSIPAGGRFGVINPSERIVVMVDEAHRTQGSDLGDNIFEAFPSATRVAFTGTPLKTERHGERRTTKRFGDYIDTYKLMDAVNDGATLQILYEGRTADTAIYDKHGFDTKFEDLFRERSPEELLAIKKKYGATGDILEAENRIHAIAEDLVNHYIDNIFPDGFKAQVVCHSKLAALRYQQGIRKALENRITREMAGQSPDFAWIGKLRFLKAAVIISSDPTNEPAAITEARQEAKRWNARENFCKPFTFDDPDADLSGIAFLIVCDMLLTGFDAPVEQVMYIDKKLTEHNLLQAIARVNRVANGKHRGYIVDYIGLANHLREALSIYSEEDGADLSEGLKNRVAEIPILEERYRRLNHHFQQVGVREIESFVNGDLHTSDAEFAVLHQAVDAMEDIKQRADFEVYLKKFLQSLNLILPHPAGHAFRGPARRFGYLLRMVKERYKDDSLDIADAGAKVKALINEHLIDLGINPKIPPVELLSDDFIEKVTEHSGGSEKAKASEMEHAIRKHCTIHFDEDPALYSKLSEKLERLLEQHKDNWKQLSLELGALREEVATGRNPEIGRHAQEYAVYADLVSQQIGVPPENLMDLIQTIYHLIQERSAVVEFWRKPIEVKTLRGDVDTELLLSHLPEVRQAHERLAIEIIKLARVRAGVKGE